MRRVYLYIVVAIALVGAMACGGSQDGALLPKFDEVTLSIEEPAQYAVNIRYQRIVNTEDNAIFADIEAQNYCNSFDGYVVEPMDVEVSAQLLADEYVEADGEDYCYNMEQTVHFTRGDTILCYETFVESYTGGVAENFSLWYECFDLATGRLYDFAYLFDGEWGGAMRELILASLRGETSDAFIEAAEMLPMADSVLIIDSGLTFIYQPDVVASFDAGIISLSISDADIAATGAPLVWVDKQ